MKKKFAGLLICCLGASAAAWAEINEAITEPPAALAPDQAIQKVMSMFSAECGMPNRCSLTRDGRGACGHTVVIQVPGAVDNASLEWMEPGPPAQRLYWVCLTRWGGLVGVHRGREAPWRRS